MDFYQKTFLLFGSLFGFLSVLAGAFGSHVLKGKLSIDNLNVFEIAVRYQMYHALALLALCGILSLYPSLFMHLTGWFFITGTIIFSGSLYLLVFTSVKTWGAVTPIGGLILLMGWLFSFLAAIFLYFK